MRISVEPPSLVATAGEETRVPIRSDADIVRARQQGRALAERCGFAGSDLVFIATAISEVARNILVYAGEGEIVVSPLEQGTLPGILVVARDEGPGVADVTLALQDGYSTSHGLGLGLPGAKRLMDDFELVSAPGRGTTVIMRKWLA